MPPPPPLASQTPPIPCAGHRSDPPSLPPSLPGRRRRRRPFRLFLRLVEKEALPGMGECPLPLFLPRCEAEAMHGRDIPKIDDIGPREAEPPRLSRGGRRRYGSKEATTPTVHHAKYFFFNVPNVKPSSEPRREWLRKGLFRPRHSAAQNINLMSGLSLLALLSLSLPLSSFLCRSPPRSGQFVRCRTNMATFSSSYPHCS